jgi:hypothetical protein
LSAGAGLTYTIMAARTHIMWFPLQPIGMLMTVVRALIDSWQCRTGHALLPF